jgi:hypothetical protein
LKSQTQYEPSCFTGLSGKTFFISTTVVPTKFDPRDVPPQSRIGSRFTDVVVLPIGEVHIFELTSNKAGLDTM